MFKVCRARYPLHKFNSTRILTHFFSNIKSHRSVACKICETVQDHCNAINTDEALHSAKLNIAKECRFAWTEVENVMVLFVFGLILATLALYPLNLKYKLV